ncbi:MAG: replication protein C [Methanomicrobiaceae archaeon]|nr:replication protein C [Methanomicrobiaceae archaeon]
MLWIEKYRPRTFEEVLGQDAVTRRLRSFAEARNVPHLLLSGPHGTGKSASVECLARTLYGDYWQENTTFLNVHFLFAAGKQYLEAEERFSHLYRKGASLIANVKYIIRWYASLKPLDAEFKLIVLEDAASLTFEAQQALRRIMETYSRTCRFIFCARNQSGIIPAISSRCLPLFFSPVPPGLTIAHLESVLDAEGRSGTVSPDDLELIAQSAGGDLRRAVTLLQVAATTGKAPDSPEVIGRETGTIAETLLLSMKEGNWEVSKRLAETLMYDDGLTGPELVEELGLAARREYPLPEVVLALADADWRLSHAGSEFVQVMALLARLQKGVGP